MSSVLYDVPGPRARARNRVLAVATVVVVLAAVGFVLWRFTLSGQFTAQKWSVFTYTNVWITIGEMLLNTLKAFALAGVLSLALGFALAIGRLSDHAWVRVPVMVVTELFRAVPVLVMMMIFYYGLPTFDITIAPYWAVVLGLTLYNGSVLAEALRAGVEALPRGQSEAGYAIGLRKSNVMMLILLPQAIRAMLPVIVAQLVVTLKDTALGFIITYPELLYYTKLLSSQARLGSPILQSAIVIGGIYIVMCLLLSWLAHWIEKRGRRSAKRPDAGPHDPAADDEVTLTEAISMQTGAGPRNAGGRLPG